MHENEYDKILLSVQYVQESKSTELKDFAAASGVVTDDLVNRLSGLFYNILEYLTKAQLERVRVEGYQMLFNNGYVINSQYLRQFKQALNMFKGFVDSSIELVELERLYNQLSTVGESVQ